jgi:hypothetical protein
LLPVPVVCEAVADASRELEPSLEADWSQASELPAQGFAIAYPLKPRARAAAVASKVLRMKSS